MPSEFEITRRVEFHEVDAVGIVHFAHFFRYMEHAEHAFIRSLGFSIHGDSFGPGVMFPRVHASCDYRQPFRFEDEIRIHLLIQEKRSKTIRYAFRFGTHNPPVRWAVTGALVVACVTQTADGLRARPLPEPLDTRLQVADADYLRSCLDAVE